MFNFDYKEDLLVMARERERVFSLSKFQTQVETEEQQETNANLFGLVYGGEGTRASVADFGDEDSEDQYAHPERAEYPEEAIANNFGDVARGTRKSAADIDRDF